MKYTVFDIESNGLLDSVTKIHCLSFNIIEQGQSIAAGTLTDYEQIKSFLSRQEMLVGHNIIRYDIPVIEKLLGITIKSKIFDTLGVSWYLQPHRKRHGLEYYGEDFGVPKPVIEDWENQTLQDYIYRCEEDVKINSLLFKKQMSYLINLYDNEEESLYLVSYLNFKLDCLREQEYIGITLNEDLVKEHLNTLNPEFDEKTRILQSIMPKDLGRIIKTKPKVMFKKDGSISSHGIKWIKYLEDNNLPLDSEVITEEPNPGSDVQLKNWLFRLGWNPITFKESKATGKKIPQVSLPFGQGICPSVKELYSVEPLLEELEGYFKIKHRIGIFESYLNSVKDGKIQATAQGFTKTLRLTHSKPFVNLPKPGVYFGKEIREVLTIPNDSFIMIGSDVTGLEDNTKQHYIYPYDPKYVEEMRVPGFDPHIDIGVLAGLISKEEEEFYKYASDQKELSPEELDKLSSIKKKRNTAKTSNFAMTYNAYPPKIAETAKISLDEATILFDTYWNRNKAIKEVADSCIIKVINGQRWLYNKLSGLWMYLSAEKDKFSSLNQSSGVYVFDNWIMRVRKKLNPLNIHIAAQYHDEMVVWFPKEHVEIVKEILLESMKETNKHLNLNVEITVSIDIGTNYAEVH